MPPVTEAWLTNTAYGYPRGAVRRVAPIALACLHITANPNTPPATAMEERDHANRADSGGPSAHDYVDRDGHRIHAIGTAYAAWSNGVLRSPKLAVPGVQAVKDFLALGFNPNEAYYREIEHCGRYSQYPITKGQVESTAWQIARDAIATGLPITRATVHLHSDLDSELRPNCPVPASQAEAWVGSVIARAQEIYQQEVQMTWEQLLAELDARYQLALAERDAAITRATNAEAEVTRLRELLAKTEASGAQIVALSQQRGG